MAKGRGRALLFFTAGGMELCWLYAAAVLFLGFTGITHVPLLESVGAFFLAAALTYLLRGQGWRILYIVLAHLICLAGFTLAILYSSWNQAVPFYRVHWIADFFTGPFGLLETVILVLLCLWSMIIWLSGIMLARRSNSFYAVSARFDIGVAVFVVLFVIAGAAQGVIPAGEYLVFSFFLFSILAIALSRSFDSTQKNYLSGFRGLGLLFTFAAAVLLFGGAGVLFFLPYLTAAADAGYVLLERAGKPLLHLLAHALIFFFRFGSRSSFQEPGTPTGDMGDTGMLQGGESSSWGQFLETIIAWGLIGFLVLSALIITGWLLWYVMGWLLQKTPTDSRPNALWETIFAWLDMWRSQWLAGLLKAVMGLLVPSKQAQGEAGKLFKRLLKWGQSCGLSRRHAETPQEYGLHLGKKFPALREDIRIITESFAAELYGGKSLATAEKARAHRAWKRLSSPYQWPRRLRFRFFGGAGQG